MTKNKRNRKLIKNNGYKLEELGIQKDDLTKEELIDIYAEAYYKALKRIENESRSENEPEHKVKDYKKYEWVQYFLNVLFFPWRIRKKFKLKDNIYIKYVNSYNKFDNVWHRCSFTTNQFGWCNWYHKWYWKITSDSSSMDRCNCYILFVFCKCNNNISKTIFE